MTVRVAAYGQQMLKNEIKLVCYIGYNNKITKATIRVVRFGVEL